LNAADLAALEHPSELRGGFKIRLAKQPRGRRHAGKLVENRYSGRGYTTSQSDQDPNLSTFIAYDEGMLVGTVSVRLDSQQGLSGDDLYRVEIDSLRGAGGRLCEFTRLAVDKSVASKPVLAGLFHTAYLYAAVIRGYTHAVIEVNPRHVTFYRRALGFEQIGAERLNQRVNAPAVLLVVPFDAIAEGLRRHAGKPPAHGASRSLFPYGFPEGEEHGVLARLRGLVPKQ
ncbi:MAG TPA: long-chain N-acyl amino acid synthase, partial [Casimicrobiaceae bacterium]